MTFINTIDNIYERLIDLWHSFMSTELCTLCQYCNNDSGKQQTFQVKQVIQNFAACQSAPNQISFLSLKTAIVRIIILWKWMIVRRQVLNCLKMASDIDITLHVYTCTCVPQVVDIHILFNRTLLHKVFHHYIDNKRR